jgi:hypothetical protein
MRDSQANPVRWNAPEHSIPAVEAARLRNLARIRASKSCSPGCSVKFFV